MKHFVDVKLKGDGKVDFVGDHEDRGLKTDGVFDPEVIEKYLSRRHREAAELGLETLRRLSNLTDGAGAESTFTLDVDSTTVSKGQKQRLSVPVGFEELDKLKRVLLELVPETRKDN